MLSAWTSGRLSPASHNTSSYRLLFLQMPVDFAALLGFMQNIRYGRSVTLTSALAQAKLKRAT